MHKIVWIFILAIGVSSCCKRKTDTSQGATGNTNVSSPASAPASTSSRLFVKHNGVMRLNFPGTYEGAKALGKAFVDPEADRDAMTQALRPSAEDYDAVFVKEVAASARKKIDEWWEKHHPIIDPKEGQTQVIVWKATTEDFLHKGGYSRKFPMGYTMKAKKLKPGVTFYRIKFVEPGEKYGRRYDSFVYVNDHWVLMPKAYRALD